jgi:hypothetical protein
MSDRKVRARHAALPETRRELDDPVVAIGEKIAAVIAALDRNDQQKPRADTADRDRSALNDYLEALESTALSQPATSLAGCMIQVALMNQMLNEREDNPSLSEYSNQQETRRFEIAVYSVIGVLYRETGRDPKTLGCDFYAGVQAGLVDRFARLMAPIHKPSA